MLTPKPHPIPSLPRPKPKRLPRKEYVTIALAFHRPEGIVFGADTRETYTGYLKRQVPKLVMRPENHQQGMPCAVFAGAGDGSLIDHLIGKLWEGMKHKTDSIEAMIDAAEDALLNAYGRLAKANHPGELPDQQILIGAWCKPNETALVEVTNTVLTRNIKSKAIGCGEYLANYIEDRFWAPKIDLGDLVPVVTYIIDQARKHVDGCGGRTHVAVIKANGEMRQLPKHETKRRTERITDIDHIARSIAKMAMDERIDDDVARQEMMQDVERIMEIRKSMRP
jgi:hypothetical protein